MDVLKKKKKIVYKMAQEKKPLAMQRQASKMKNEEFAYEWGGYLNFYTKCLLNLIKFSHDIYFI